MNDNEILKRAIAKAEETGWAGPTFESTEWFNFECIIFDHSFAKAFWGFDKVPLLIKGGDFNIITESIDGIDYRIAWKYHLLEMILEEEPLKYLEKFLKGSVN